MRLTLNPHAWNPQGWGTQDRLGAYVWATRLHVLRQYSSYVAVSAFVPTFPDLKIEQSPIGKTMGGKIASTLGPATSQVWCELSSWRGFRQGGWRWSKDSHKAGFLELRGWEAFARFDLLNASKWKQEW